MDTLTARPIPLELQLQIWQSDPTGDADPQGGSPDSSSEGHTAEANANPPVPMETNGIPGESSGSLSAARTEPGEIEEIPGRSFYSLQKGQAGQQPLEKKSTIANRETPSTPLRRASAHSPLSKKNETDPDFQEMSTGAGNNKEVLRARNSYQISAVRE